MNLLFVFQRIVDKALDFFYNVFGGHFLVEVDVDFHLKRNTFRRRSYQIWFTLIPKMSRLWFLN